MSKAGQKLFFSSGYISTLEEVIKAVPSRKEEVQQALEELQGEYESKQQA